MYLKSCPEVKRQEMPFVTLIVTTSAKRGATILSRNATKTYRSFSLLDAKEGNSIILLWYSKKCASFAGDSMPLYSMILC
jgi:hypothetical protein